MSKYLRTRFNGRVARLGNETPAAAAPRDRRQQAIALGDRTLRHHGQVDKDPGKVEQARKPARHEDNVQCLDPEVQTSHSTDYGGAQKKEPRPWAGAEKP